MIRLSLLGSLDLRASDGRQMLSVLAQPKRVALLAYLAANRDYVRRDTLLGLFWPESDEERARHALRQSLYTLRRSLGPRALSARGDEELGIDCDHLECDVAAFEAAVRDGRAEAALELYKGDLLEGFFLSDAPEFEKWLDGRRVTLRNQAADAAWVMARIAEDAGDRVEAAVWGRKAADFSQDDEATLQRLVGMLDRLGDRAAALRAYEAFAWRLENELGLHPSPETKALVSEIRAREAAAPRDAEAKASPARAQPVDGEDSLPDESLLEGAPKGTAEFELAAAEVSGKTAAERVRGATAARVTRTTAEPTDSATGIGAAEAQRPDVEPKKHRVLLGMAVAALAVAAVIVDFAEIVQWAASRFYGDGSDSGAVEAPMEVPAADLDPRRIAVLYFDDLSEGGGYDYYAAGLTEWLITALSKVQGLEVISRNGVKPYRDTGITHDGIVRDLRVGTLVEGSVAVTEARVRVTVQLIDAATDTHIDSDIVEKPRGDHLALLDEVTKEVSVFLREQLGEDIRVREARPGTESSEAWEYLQRASRAADDAAILANGGNLDAARTAYERADNLLLEAESLDPGWLLPIIDRGWMAYRAAWLGEPYPSGPKLLSALMHAERAVEKGAFEPRALELRGTLLAYLGWDEADPDTAAARFESAERDLLAAVDTDPSLARAWAHLSLVYIRTGRFEEARWAADRALEADAFLEEKEHIWYWNGVAALQQEEIEAALRWATEGRQLYPENRGLVGLLLMTYATGVDDPPVEEAWSLVDILVSQLGPEDAPLRWMMMASVLARAGLPDSSRSVIRRAQEVGSDNPYFHYFEAAARLALGEPDAAILKLEDYLNARPAAKAHVAEDWLWRPLDDDPRFQALVAEAE